jgi:hypothetical protein
MMAFPITAGHRDVDPGEARVASLVWTATVTALQFIPSRFSLPVPFLSSICPSTVGPPTIAMAPTEIAGTPPTPMDTDVEGTARLPVWADGAGLLLDRCARTYSTMAAVLGAKPWLGVYSVRIGFGPRCRLEVLRLALSWRRATVPRLAVPSRNVTEPIGVRPWCWRFLTGSRSRAEGDRSTERSELNTQDSLPAAG